MFNALYEPLPDSYEGYPIDTSYGTAIQVQDILQSKELTVSEAVEIAVDYLFGDCGIPEEMWNDAIAWWLNGWCHDDTKSDDNDIKTMDYNFDQWRIIAVFRSQYGIDLTDPDTDIHWWLFMGLLSAVDECALTRVCDIRGKKIDGKMSSREKQEYMRLKRIYSIQSIEERQQIEKEKQRINAILGD